MPNTARLQPFVPIQKVGRFRLNGNFSHNKTFGVSAVPAEIPESLYRVPQYIKDQGFTNYCTAAARSAAASYFFNREMSFEYMTAKEGEVTGTPIFDGADPNKADTAGMEYGFLPQELSPLSFVKDGWKTPANWSEYPTNLNDVSQEFTAVPFNVYPNYQGIKEALISGHSDDAVVIANGFWYDDFNNSAAILPVPINPPISRHSYIFIDFKSIHGKEYLIAQLSQGKTYGDDGIMYMSQEVVDSIFKSPSFNGLGCVIYRKGAFNPVLTRITLLHRLLSLLGQIYELITRRP